MIAILALAGCDGEEPLGCAAFDVSFVTEDSMQRPETTFVAGEFIRLKVSATNTGADTQTLNPQNCPQFSFRIRDAASQQLVWEYGSDTVNAPLMICAGAYALDPGETGGALATWSQQDLDGNPVPTGQYVATASDSSECSATFDRTTAFTIQ